MDKKNMKIALGYKIDEIKNESYFKFKKELNQIDTLNELMNLSFRIDDELNKIKLEKLQKQIEDIKKLYLLNIHLFSKIDQTKIEKHFQNNNNIYTCITTIQLLEMKIVEYIKYLKRKEENNSCYDIQNKLNEFKKTLKHSLPYLESSKLIEIKDIFNNQIHGIINIEIIENLIKELEIIIEIEKEFLKTIPDEDLEYYTEKVKDEIIERDGENEFVKQNIVSKENLLFLRKYNNQKNLH